MTISIQQLMKQVEDVRDRFYAAVYLDGDVDAAVAVAEADCELRDLPAGAGTAPDLMSSVVGRARPADVRIRRVSRTGDRWRVADEFRMVFTHDRVLPWLLPGVPPTHRAAEVLAMSFVEVRRGRVVSCRTMWDVSGLATQLGVPLRVSAG